MSLFEGLTDAQRSAVAHIDGPLLVVAGPGSGKTRVVTRRIAHLVEEGIPPRNILALTFTNKAAAEMHERVQHLLPGARVWVGTFHKLCARLLRQYAEAVGLQSNYTILDDGDQRRLLKEVLSDLDLDPTHYSPSKVGYRIGKLKNDLVTVEEFLRAQSGRIGDIWDAVLAKVYPAYQRRLVESNAVDFDDLLLHVYRMLQENDELRAELDERYQYILVDEYQDTNAAQYGIIGAISQRHRNLCATGDPDQSIYGWRGARIGNILQFEHDFPGARVVRLEHNFRSTGTILRSADSLIVNNHQRKSKVLIPTRSDGDAVELLCYGDGTFEAEGIAHRIRELVRTGPFKCQDIAIVYRVNALSRQLELALLKAGVPFQVAAGVAFYDRAEIKDVLAYLRLILNPADRAAFLRVVNTPLRGLGATSQQKLARFAEFHGLTLLEAASRAREVPSLSARAVKAFYAFAKLIEGFSLASAGSVAELIEHVVKKTGYTAQWAGSSSEQDQQRVFNVEELITAARQYDTISGDERSLDGFLEQTALVSDTDALDGGDGKVTLMTLHASKGLEFGVVFIVGLEQGLIPHERAINSDGDREIEEERRLLFVGMTRAKDKLYLTRTAVRAFRGKTLSTIDSPFLDELEAERVQEQDLTAYPAWDQVIRGSRAGGTSSGKGNRPLREPRDFDEPITQLREESASDQPSESSLPTDEIGESFAEDEGDLSFNVDEFEAPVAPPPPPVRSVRESRRGTAGAMPLRARLMTGADLLSSQQARAEDAAPTAYGVGAQVRHPRYGLGVVTAAGGIGKHKTVTVEFAADRTETFILGKCPLQPVGAG